MTFLEEFARRCHLWNDEYLLSELQKGPSGYARLDHFRIIEAEALARGLAPPASSVLPEPVSPRRSGRLLRRLWRGEAPLVETFWIWGVGVNLLLLLVVIVAGPAAPLIGMLALIVGWLAVILAIAYLPFIAVAIWRSAGRYKGPAIWSVLARTVVVLRIVRLLWLVWQSV